MYIIRKTVNIQYLDEGHLSCLTRIQEYYKLSMTDDVHMLMSMQTKKMKSKTKRTMKTMKRKKKKKKD